MVAECRRVDLEIQHAEQARVVESIRVGLLLEAREASEKVVGAHAVYEEKEGPRAEAEVVPATAAAATGLIQSLRVTRGVVQACEEALARRRLPPATADEVCRQGRVTEDAYRRDTETYGDTHLLGEEELRKPEWAGDLRGWEEFKQAAADLEAAWEGYRRAWLELVGEVHAPASHESAALGIRLLLAKQRAGDLEGQT